MTRLLQHEVQRHTVFGGTEKVEYQELLMNLSCVA